ncbi:MAG TPA: tRNA dihydrouridine(20/20a) synthase DusA [Nevskiaceae bacterium]|nr:tRNA dihydrouridine(20/20a) synthase DusA [Nevskiaceae bacterium]
MSSHSPHRFCVAPMLDWTDRHCRYFFRLMSKHARVYTEMLAAGAVLHGGPRLLKYNKAEHPIALQVGGSDADEMAQCAESAEEFGYDEININCGCPSDRVQEGRFGACLMREPQRVAECVSMMTKSASVPVTVKTRIGIDHSEDYVFVRRFVDIVAEAGCDTFIIHARKAWLQGLSPKENREIPPLNYDVVYRLKQEFPQLTIIINGGIHTFEECDEHLKHVDGVMLGRELYDNPFRLAEVDRHFFGRNMAPLTREQVIDQLKPYIENELRVGTGLSHITRHILGLYRGQPGGRRFRQVLSENAHKLGAGIAVLEAALAEVRPDAPDLIAA